MRFFHRIPAFIMVYHKLFFDRFQYLYQIPANFTYQICPNLLSLPVRERGLKFSQIEAILTVFPTSLPVRERGLKSGAGLRRCIGSRVAPRAGAWIEIPFIMRTHTWYPLSLPVRERGLKYVVGGSQAHSDLSLPVRERGLK